MSDDGGPAFPRDGTITDTVWPQAGMTLRDWFAGLAMQAAISNPVNDTETFTTIASEAYQQADAMLAERAKP